MFIKLNSFHLILSVIVFSLMSATYSNAIEISVDGAKVKIEGGKIEVSSNVEDSQNTNVGNNHDVNIGGVKIKDGAKVENSEISTEAEVHNVIITNTGEGKDIIVGGIEIGGD